MKFEASEFESARQETFRVADGDGRTFNLDGEEERDAIDLELVDVKAGAGDCEDVHQFSAIYRNPSGIVVPQGTYVFDHPQYGPTDLFVVPIQGGPNGVYYQACFSRLR